MQGLIMAAQMIAALSLLVGIHEWGHYITAKWFKTQVDKFFIFFDAPFGKRSEEEIAAGKSKYAWDGKLIKWRKGETEYGLGWLPLGGYVKIAGMIDESMDTDFEKVPDHKQFRFKPAWQKLIIMMGGIIMNVITGVAIFIGLNLANKQFVPLKNMTDYVVSTVGKETGIQEGDVFIGANGKEILREQDLMPAVAFGGTLNIERNGQPMELTVPEDFYDRKERLFYPRTVTTIADFREGIDFAKNAGLQKGDELIAIKDTPVYDSKKFANICQANKGDTVNIQVKRNGALQTLPVEISDKGEIGIAINSQITSKFETAKMGFGDAVTYGTKDAFGVVSMNIKAFGRMFQGKMKVKDNVAGPIGIAKSFGGTWNWTRFWTLTGSLSMILAFMNFLPIPALDGGHVVFALVEMVTGKRVPEKLLITVQTIGFYLLMGLMILIFGNDILNLFK